jgi:hypothetical protein
MTGQADAIAELQGRIAAGAPQPISDLLDSLDEPTRLAAVYSLDRPQQRALWRAADGFRPVRILDLVPAGTPDLTAVRHYGKNTLPMFRMFEKRFYRPSGQDAAHPKELGGANFQSLQPLTGPGYFVAYDSPSRPEVLVDYYRVPTEKPSDFFPIEENKRNRGGLVYGYMIDTLRRVSEHVTIGSAAKHGKDINSWFVLCREVGART